MTDEKEEFIDTVSIKMNLDKEQTRRLRNILSIELYNYSLTRIECTDIIVRDETLSEKALRMFLMAKNVEVCTERTLKYYRYQIKGFFEEMDWKPVDQITTNDIRYYLAIKKERDHNSDRNVDNHRRVLSSFFGWLHTEEYISRNPVAKIRKIRIERYVKKPFRDIEIEKLRYGAREDVRLNAILEVMLSTGCRISEIYHMDRKDLDGDEIIVRGKGKKERPVYLNAKARYALMKYLESRDDDNPAMFVAYDRPHHRLKISGIGSGIRELGRKCEVPDTHPHRFRRTAATMAINRGMPIEQVQIMLGHESIETTTIYAISAQETVKTSHKKYLG